MKTEKVIISFIAVVVGILAAGIVFYFYQTTKTIQTSKIKPVSFTSPSPTPKPSVFLTIARPKDEDVQDTKTITISGATKSDAVVVILTKTGEQVLTPTANGNFTTTITLEDGVNQIEVTAVAPNGEEARAIRTVTYSTENF